MYRAGAPSGAVPLPIQLESPSRMRNPQAELFRAVHGEQDLPGDGRPELALAGRSNVGKSSLLNRLLGRAALARVSRTPGRTRAIHFYLVDRRFYVVDLPGYGYARASRSERARWGGLIEAYFDRPRRGRSVLLLVDGEVGATPLDQQAAAYLGEVGVPFAVVATKIDKVPRGRRAGSLAAIRGSLALAAERPVHAFSSHTGEGTRELWRYIEDFLAVAGAPHAEREEGRA